MQGIGHRCNKCPFKLTCENCFLELTIYVPDQYSIEEYMQKTALFLNNAISEITRQHDNTYNVETENGQTLKNVKFDLNYMCKLSIENKQQQPTQQPKQCPSNKAIEEGEIAIKTIIYKKPKTNQEIKVPIEKLSEYI